MNLLVLLDILVSKIPPICIQDCLKFCYIANNLNRNSKENLQKNP